jgi:hypothetical protein
MSVEIPEYGGCVWPVDPACLSDTWEAMDTTVQDRALALASSTLERLVGRRVGVCPITVRPFPLSGSCFVPDSYSYTPFMPGVDVNGGWVNNCGAGSFNNTGIYLPPPVGTISEVKVDGVVVDPSGYRVIEGNRLILDVPYPRAQDVTLPDTEDGTFAVTYLNAYPVDSNGAYAAGILAMEFAKACSGAKCRLPRNVTNVVRQGISYEIAAGSFPDGKTGIHEVDTYVALWNPDNQRRSQVWSPDMPRVSW